VSRREQPQFFCFDPPLPGLFVPLPTLCYNGIGSGQAWAEMKVGL